MSHRHLLNTLCLSLATAFGVGPAWGLGFARLQPSVQLGAPLDLALGVRLDSGEMPLLECVSAEVWIGESQLPRAAIATSVEMVGESPQIRIRTITRIDEPVVTVNVTAGCAGKISRRYTLFADPPGSAPASPSVAVPEPKVPLVAAAPSTPSQLPESVAATPVTPRTAAARPARPPTSEQRGMREPSPARPRAQAPVAATAREGGAVETTPRRDRPTGGSAARLRLDAPIVTYAADRAAAEALERREAEMAAVRVAVQLAQAAANSATTRVSTMEASVAALKAESKANREAMARLQESLAQADARGQWTPWLIALALALLGAAGWLYARVRRLESERQRGWWNSSLTAQGAAAAKEAEAGARDAMADEAQAVEGRPVASAAPATTAAVAPKVSAPSAAVATPATAPPPPSRAPVASPVRDVSVEELLDVEQQAEFFVVLGQDDAAIDLLTGHLRSTGGASPLPYLKLLEIHRRRGDEAAYERMRKRFNERFNAAAPDWTTDLSSGRSILDYPQILATIEASWPRPQDAMAELEALLFKTDAADMFDLPAYRDVLFLFTLARDVKEMAFHELPEIDLPLPLGGANASHRGPAPTGVAVRPGGMSAADPVTLTRELTRPAPLDDLGQTAAARQAR